MPELNPQIGDSAAAAVRRYDELKLEVGAIAQTAMLQCAKVKDQESERDFQRLLARLTEDRFNLAVVGPFSRGKSSLMNAILGFDALPTGLLPHTSVVTTVTYGPRERVLIRFRGWPFPQEIRLDQLEEYVTERGNPGNRRCIALAEIQLPAEILRRGLHFIDTPGVGSAILANTYTTEKFLPEIDAAIFVISFDSAISEGDVTFLAQVRAAVGVVFVVLNKLDLVSDSQREDVLRFVGEHFDRDPRIGRCTLFSVSAKRGLQAKLDGDSAALARSGLPELEAALAQFLSTDKTWQLSSRIVDRLIRYLQRQRASEKLISAANQSDQRRAAALQDLDTRLAELKIRLSDGLVRLTPLVENTLRALEPRIDTAFRRLKDDLLKMFESNRSWSGLSLNLVIPSSLAPDISALCTDALDRELPAYEAALNGEWQRQASSLLVRIRGLAEELVNQPANENGSIDESQGLGTEADDINLHIGQIPPIEWRPHRRWWLRLVPLQSFPAASKKWIGNELDDALAQYRDRLESAARDRISTFINDFIGAIEKAIDVRAQRIKQSIVRKGFVEDSHSLDHLLRQARVLRLQLDNRSHSSTPEGTSQRLSVTAGISGRDDFAGHIRPCPVCRAIVDAVFGYLSKLQYELSVEVAAQKQLAETGGFCSAHTWIYSRLTSPVGISRAYPLLLESDAAKLELVACTAASLETLTTQVEAILPSQLRCNVCVLGDRTAREMIRKIVKELDSNDATPIPTLCLPHIEMALRCGAQLKSGRTLAYATAQAMSRIADNMRRHGLKHDALRRNLMTTEERDAGRSGLQKLAGEMLLVLPPSEDDRL